MEFNRTIELLQTEIRFYNGCLEKVGIESTGKLATEYRTNIDELKNELKEVIQISYEASCVK